MIKNTLQFFFILAQSNDFVVNVLFSSSYLELPNKPVNPAIKNAHLIGRSSFSITLSKNAGPKL